MRVFVTGASGHIGSAVVADLLAAGHEVAGLARSDASAEAIAAAGAEPLRGDLDDVEGLARAAAGADGVIHLAFRHETMRTGDYMSAIATDLAATRALGEALAGTGKPFVNTTGTLGLAMAGVTGRAGLESDTVPGGPRADAENETVAFAERGVRAAVIRLPPVVHSDLDHHGFTPSLIGIARERGVAGFVGDGSNRWPAVHTLDAARAYRLALESAPAGSRLHAVAEEGVPFRELAEAIGRGVGVPAESVAPEAAGEHFGFLGALVGLDNPTSSAVTRELLGWRPEHAGLIEDVEAGHYFEG